MNKKRNILFFMLISLLILLNSKCQVGASIINYDKDYPRIYDVPMSRECQEELFKLCLKYDVEPQLVMGIIKTESDFKADTISNTEDYGLMQINKRNHKWLSDTLGVTDFLDPVQNMTAGVYVISGYLKEYPDYHKALMVYNMGEVGANRLFKRGVVQSEYSKKVMSNFDNIKFVKELD